MRNFVSPHHDRIAKLSEKLGGLQSSLQQDRTGRIDSVETKIANIEENYLESHDALAKKYNGLKDEISAIKAAVDDESRARERYIGDKMRDVRMLEDSFSARIDSESNARKDMEARLYRNIEDRTVTLRSDVLRDIKNGLGEMEKVHQEVTDTIAPLNESIADNTNRIEDMEQGIRAQLNEEVDNLTNAIQVEKASREDTEEALMQMLKDVVSHIKQDLDNERKDREMTEETLLNLLEDTCSKLTSI